MKKQSGFGLLEILITLVLLGVGVAGLVALARSMLSASQEGRRYEKAMRLAESEIDDLRNFNGVVALASGATGTLYKDIVSGSGSSQTPPGDISGDSYDLNRYVCNQYWNGVAWSPPIPPPPSKPNCTAGATNPDRKVVTVEVKWSDNGGVPRYLQLAGAITPIGSFTSEETGDSLVKHRDGPKVDYEAGRTPDVVAVALGGNSNKETSKPTPDIKSDGTISRQVQFETVTYSSNKEKKVKQDSVTVTCSCKKSSQPGFGYTPTKVSYSQTADAQYWTPGQKISKPSIGEVNEINGKPQEDLCYSTKPSQSSCCRDHYDVTNMGFAGYYNPLISSTKPSDVYQDACRFVRIDGYYRPAPDWNLVALNVFSDTFFQGKDGQKNLENYQKYIRNTIIEYAKIQREAFAGKCNAQPDGISWTPPITLPIASLKTFKATYGDYVTKFSVSLSSKTKQLISRGLYIDIMSPCYLDTIDFNNEGDILSKVPFQEVNMTLLTEWFSFDTTKATVANNAIKTIQDPDLNYYTATYRRGEVTLKNVTYNSSTSSDEPVTIKAVSLLGNAGMAGTLGTNINDSGLFESTIQVSIDNSTPNKVTYEGDIQCLDVDISGGNPKVYTIIGCGSINLTPVATNVSSGGSVDCSVVTQGGQATPKYSCVGTTGTSFEMGLSKNGYVFTYEKPYVSPGLAMPMPINIDDPAPGKCILIRTQNLIDNASKLLPKIVPTACIPPPP